MRHVTAYMIGALLLGAATGIPIDRALSRPTVVHRVYLDQWKWPDDLEVIVEITPEITDPYRRCVAVLEVAQIDSTVCQAV